MRARPRSGQADTRTQVQRSPLASPRSKVVLADRSVQSGALQCTGSDGPAGSATPNRRLAGQRRLLRPAPSPSSRRADRASDSHEPNLGISAASDAFKPIPRACHPPQGSPARRPNQGPQPSHSGPHRQVARNSSSPKLPHCRPSGRELLTPPSRPRARRGAKGQKRSMGQLVGGRVPSGHEARPRTRRFSSARCKGRRSREGRRSVTS